MKILLFFLAVVLSQSLKSPPIGCPQGAISFSKQKTFLTAISGSKCKRTREMSWVLATVNMWDRSQEAVTAKKSIEKESCKVRQRIGW